VAQADAEGIYRILVARGIIEDASLAPLKPFAGLAAPIEHVEMVRSPCSGAILYHVKPGDRVEQGTEAPRSSMRPASRTAQWTVTAPQAGLVLTRAETGVSSRQAAIW
jgi:predicted deacylase